MEYLNWGCEFVSEPNRQFPKKYIENAIWLPIELLLETSKQEVEENRLNARLISIAEEGLLEPGILIVGQNAAYLRDGNHRLQSAARLNWTHFPVEIELVERPIKKGLSLNKLIVELLKREEIVKFK